MIHQKPRECYEDKLVSGNCYLIAELSGVGEEKTHFHSSMEEKNNLLAMWALQCQPFLQVSIILITLIKALSNCGLLQKLDQL